MQTEITTPDRLVLDARVPMHVVEWAFKRNEPRVELGMTKDGLNCWLKSGAMTLEFDARGTGRTIAGEVLAMTGRDSLAQVGGSLEGVTVAPGGEL